MIKLYLEVKGAKELEKKLKDMRERVRDLRPILEREATIILREAAARIRKGGDPPWTPTKAPSNVHAMLQRTGLLLNSLQNGLGTTRKYESATGILFGTVVPYAPFLQFGTSKSRKFSSGASLGRLKRKPSSGLPARPFLYVTDQDRSRLARKFREFVVSGMADSDLWETEV
jgi:phage gpG-like protein